MTSEAYKDSIFKIETCRAIVRGSTDLVDCLSLKQAVFCCFSLPFGSGHFCKHPQRNNIIMNTKKESETDPQADSLKN